MNLFHQRLSLHKSTTFSIGKEAHLLYWQVAPKIEYPGDKMRLLRDTLANLKREAAQWQPVKKQLGMVAPGCVFQAVLSTLVRTASVLWSACRFPFGLRDMNRVQCQRRQVKGLGLFSFDTQQYWQCYSYMIRLATCKFIWQLWLIVDIREMPGRLEDILEKYRPS